MGDLTDKDRQAFCTRAGRFAELEALAAMPAKAASARPEVPETHGSAAQPTAMPDWGVGRYFRWASRST